MPDLNWRLARYSPPRRSGTEFFRGDYERAALGLTELMALLSCLSSLYYPIPDDGCNPLIGIGPVGTPLSPLPELELSLFFIALDNIKRDNVCPVFIAHSGSLEVTHLNSAICSEHPLHRTLIREP